jgi:hypothetical protein
MKYNNTIGLFLLGLFSGAFSSYITFLLHGGSGNGSTDMIWLLFGSGTVFGLLLSSYFLFINSMKRPIALSFILGIIFTSISYFIAVLIYCQYGYPFLFKEIGTKQQIMAILMAGFTGTFCMLFFNRLSFFYFLSYRNIFALTILGGLLSLTMLYNPIKYGNYEILYISWHAVMAGAVGFMVDRYLFKKNQQLVSQT